MTAARGEAGPRGESVRSDLHVIVEPAAAAAKGVTVRITSKVGSIYGASIRREVEATLARLGGKAARVTVEDQGALPYVIEARVEAAARRAGLGGDVAPGSLEGLAAIVGGAAHAGERVESARDAPEGAAPGGGARDAAAGRDRLRRSRLYLPGDQPKFQINAGLHGADAVILDLEDSVHPAEKDAARLVARNALLAVDFRGAERWVRINAPPVGFEDLEVVVPAGVDGVLLPKVEDPETVREAARRIRAIREREGGGGEVWLMPILETARGVEEAFPIASADPSVVALTIGLEDYTADLGVVKTREGGESRYARMRLVNAARAAGVQPIDSVWGDVGDLEGLRAWAREARAMGFAGMGCIHPRQIAPIHEAFAPSPAEIEKALRIVGAWREAEARGRAVVTLGSRMIDPPVVLRARRIAELARRMGRIEGGGEAAGGKAGSRGEARPGGEAAGEEGSR